MIRTKPKHSQAPARAGATSEKKASSGSKKIRRSEDEEGTLDNDGTQVFVDMETKDIRKGRAKNRWRRGFPLRDETLDDANLSRNTYVGLPPDAGFTYGGEGESMKIVRGSKVVFKSGKQNLRGTVAKVKEDGSLIIAVGDKTLLVAKAAVLKVVRKAVAAKKRDEEVRVAIADEGDGIDSVLNNGEEKNEPPQPEPIDQQLNEGEKGEAEKNLQVKADDEEEEEEGEETESCKAGDAEEEEGEETESDDEEEEEEEGKEAKAGDAEEEEEEETEGDDVAVEPVEQPKAGDEDVEIAVEEDEIPGVKPEEETESDDEGEEEEEETEGDDVAVEPIEQPKAGDTEEEEEETESDDDDEVDLDIQDDTTSEDGKEVAPEEETSDDEGEEKIPGEEETKSDDEGEEEETEETESCKGGDEKDAPAEEEACDTMKSDDDDDEEEEPAETQVMPIATDDDLEEPVTKEDVTSSLYGADTENPHYAILIKGHPVAALYLEDLPNPREAQAHFLSEQFAETLAESMEKFGIKPVLKNLKARMYANLIDQNSLAKKMKAAAKSEMLASYRKKVLSMVDDFTDAMRITIAGFNKNYWPESNELKATLADVLHDNLGIGNPVPYIEKAFEVSADTHFERLISKAVELMGKSNETRDELRKLVADSAVRVEAAGDESEIPEEETESAEEIEERLVKGSLPVDTNRMGKSNGKPRLHLGSKLQAEMLPQ